MIPKIKNILYATDLSKNSAYAFRYAVISAQKHKAYLFFPFSSASLRIDRWSRSSLKMVSIS